MAWIGDEFAALPYAALPAYGPLVVAQDLTEETAAIVRRTLLAGTITVESFAYRHGSDSE